MWVTTVVNGSGMIALVDLENHRPVGVRSYRLPITFDVWTNGELPLKILLARSGRIFTGCP
jgi:hypothetical protein